MVLSHVLAEGCRLELEKWSRRPTVEDLRARFVAFTGTPRPHPENVQRLLLLADPFSSRATYYDFDLADIAYAEEIANLVSPEGDTALMVRLWVRRRAVAIHCTPFVVGAE